jgi:hypothetical protein
MKDLMDTVLTDSPSAPLLARGGFLQFLRRHGLLVGIVSVFATAFAARPGKEITQDTWLALAAGRTVAHDGIPRHDHLTLWTLGTTWVDQQWLAHLVAYGAYAGGGLVLLAFVQFLLVSTTVAGAAAHARAAAGATRPVAWLLIATVYPIGFGAGSIRTQDFALPLFAAVLVLLVRDVDEPKLRVFWVLPLLVLWANVHGSVVVGVALVMLRALIGIRGPTLRARSLVLGSGAVAAAVATPYGVAIFPYYHHTLLNGSFWRLVAEWQPLTLGLTTAPSYLLIGVAVWLMARHLRETGTFGFLAELLLILLSLVALRNVVWLGLGSLILLARPLAAELGARELVSNRINVMFGVAAPAVALVAVIAMVGRGGADLVKSFPAAAGDAVATAAASRPGAPILADERFADWLLFTHPSLEGRVLYDVRFELLTSKQLTQIYDWKSRTTAQWQAPARSSGVVVLDLQAEPKTRTVLENEASFQQTYADGRMAVFVRER